MKNINFVYLFIVLIVVSSVIYYLLYLKNQNNKGHTSKCKNKENFTSGFRRMYRPYIRHARVYYHNRLNFIKNKSAVLLKRWGII
jgi:hypothetical protein